jgi:type II secretory pathway predicted ATPase ExeA
MYESFFGLTERPFSLLPDPDFLYLSPQHKLARAYLEYGLTQKLGFVVLTGEIGTGKTTLIKSLLKARAGKQRLGVLYQTSFGAEDLLELLLKEFEITGSFTAGPPACPPSMSSSSRLTAGGNMSSSSSMRRIIWGLRRSRN